MVKLNGIILAFVCLFVNSHGEKLFPQMWQINGNLSDATINQLIQNGDLDLWSTYNGKLQVAVSPNSIKYSKRKLKNSQIEFDIVEENLLDLINEEQKHMQERRRHKRAAEQMDWSSYHKLDDIEGYLGWLNATQDKVVVFPVAITSEGRRVYVAKVSNGRPSRYRKKKVWIEGGIHAREWISPAVTTYLLHQVATSKEFRPILEHTEWYFVPVANPDGYQYSFKGPLTRMWRKNRKRISFLLPGQCRGVDLNRNWPYKFGVGASANPCSNVYKGSRPLSEPETEGLKVAMEREGPFDLFITFHSYGQTVLYPWGWTTEPPSNHEELAHLADKFVDAVTYASRQVTTYKHGGSAELYGMASGASDDWAYGDLGVPFSYTIELRDTGKYGFNLPESQILETVQETAVGVYCMASYLSDVGVCSRRMKFGARDSDSHVIFE